jgi:hypothetical protein
MSLSLQTNYQLPVGAENRVTSCDLHILVYEAAEPVSSEHADARPRTWRGAVGCQKSARVADQR